MPRHKRPIERTTDGRGGLNPIDQESFDIFGLSTSEKRWAGYYEYLMEKGYQLRPRFRPGWTPSWSGTNLSPDDCEDSWSRISKVVLDAVRLSDRRQVMIKKVVPSANKSESQVQEELRIIKHLSSPTLRDDPRNHVMEYLDSFPVPDIPGGIFIVSTLYVYWDFPEFETMNEALECIRQVLEGLSFLHQNHVAHRDCVLPNIMMDIRPLIDEPIHPIRNRYTLDGEYFIDIRTRSQAPVRYYYIDFDISVLFEPDDARLAYGQVGRLFAPEVKQAGTKPYDPFKVDVYLIGTFLEQEFLKKFHGFGFLKPLIRGMKRKKPKNRFAAAHAEQSYLKLVASISPRTREWPLIPRGSGLLTSLEFTLGRFWNQFTFLLQKIYLFVLGRWSRHSLIG